MSITELSEPNKMHKKLCHWRNDSGELDVFEAARYFSGGGADEVLGCGATLAQKVTAPRTARMSLDMPTTRSLIPSQTYNVMEKQILKEKKNKQPSSPGFRTPPPHANTPTKSYKDFRNFSDYNKQIISVQKFNGNVKSDYSSSWLDEKFKFSNGYSDKNWNDKYPSEENEFRKFSDVDDGADSDSSSDLFDLPNHELDFYSSDLPVYETTHIDSIKRAVPISSTGKV
ncbi:protein BIG GRAIN 1-like E [Forsythia ovata]|uniref:Protein BIG GRAIN 1-like E n=1 Tax=Forsythia ovata TaxID=205694 RepID=A0ABD1WAB8_9LAMI